MYCYGQETAAKLILATEKFNISLNVGYIQIYFLSFTCQTAVCNGELKLLSVPCSKPPDKTLLTETFYQNIFTSNSVS